MIAMSVTANEYVLNQRKVIFTVSEIYNILNLMFSGRMTVEYYVTHLHVGLAQLHVHTYIHVSTCTYSMYMYLPVHTVCTCI